jgi:flagellar protein FliO/FliZ
MNNLTSSITSTLMALIFVGILAWLGIWLLKRLQQGGLIKKGVPNPEQLRFVRALAVGAKERLVVVHYRNQEWLLGVGSASITVLEKYPLDLPVSDQNQAPALD